MPHHFVLILLITVTWSVGGTVTAHGTKWPTVKACEAARESFETAETVVVAFTPPAFKEGFYAECRTYFDRRADHV